MSFSLAADALVRSHGSALVLDAVSVVLGARSRLGVVGPNGVGKSTLLRILAGLEAPDGGRVRASPPTLNVGYLPQEPEVRPGETLLASLARRTGVSGAEAALQAAAEGLAGRGGGPGAEDEERYSRALERYLALGGPDLEARAGAVCDDLGLPADRLDVELGALSGGQAARASLAAIVLSRFDVLLLDEPTNDLDFAGLDRLERFVRDSPASVVIVSHDRAFLQATVERVLELDEHSHRATEYGGGWLAYLEARVTAQRHAQDSHATYVAERGRLLERARAQRQWATVGAAAKKKKAPDHDKAQRDWRVNRTEKQAAKVRITEKALDAMVVIDKPWEGWNLHLSIATAPRSGDVVARLQGAVVQRGSFRLGPLDVEIGWAERVAVLGPSGIGKTTLLGALLGQVPLAAGERWLGPGVVVGELDQGRRHFLTDEPVLTAFSRASALPPKDARSLLAKFGLVTDHVGRRAAQLSPGERTRLVLALLMAIGVNCLVLDEPTNHLDLPAIDQLEQALARWEGTLLLVTHDRRLLETVRVDRTIELG